MSKKKRILFIAKNIPIPEDQRGNKIIYTIADKLCSLYDVSFIFPKSRVPWALHFMKKYKPLYKLRDWQYKGHDVCVIPFIQLPGLNSTYWLFNRLPKRAILHFKKNRYDLIHAHYGMPDGYLAYLLSKRFDVPYVLTLRNHDVLHLNRLKPVNLDYKKYLKVLRNASKVLVTNASLVEYFKQLGILAEILPHGIEESHIAKSPKVTTEGVIRISCVSNYIASKNIEWVIDAVLQYAGNETVELFIVGDVEGLAQKYLTLDNQRIHILGRQPHEKVMDILESSDIFALPSQFETFGMVYLEAAAKQNAIIGYKGQGVWGVFEDGDEMLFCENYNDFRLNLFNIIENEDQRNILVKNAFKKAKSYTWNLIIERYNNIYNEYIKY